MKDLDAIVSNEREWRQYLIGRIDRQDAKLDLLFAFKWQIIGGSVVLSTLAAIAVQLLAK